MSPEIVLRPALDSDFAARAALVRAGFSSYQWDAFLLFFFQELTLQGCVLGGAVMFIFLGASLPACLLVLPAAAVFTAVAVAIAHMALADTHVQGIRGELFGVVAEYRGPLLAGEAPPPGPVPLRAWTTAPPPPAARHLHTMVVGTASVSELRGSSADGGWLHALAVHPQWRRRGVGLSVSRAILAAAGAGGLGAMHTVLSQLQHAARHLLHAHGWEVRGGYHRRLCGPALTLPLVHLARMPPQPY